MSSCGLKRVYVQFFMLSITLLAMDRVAIRPMDIVAIRLDSIRYCLGVDFYYSWRMVRDRLYIGDRVTEVFLGWPLEALWEAMLSD